MFNKKYSPLVLTKTTMLSFHLMEKGLRFILQDEMNRFLHMTIDESRWDESEKDFSSTRYKAEISALVLLRNGKSIGVEVETTMRMFSRNEWEIQGIQISFPTCKVLKGGWIYLRYRERDEVIQNLLMDYQIHFPGNDDIDSIPDVDQRIQYIKLLIMAS